MTVIYMALMSIAASFWFPDLFGLDYTAVDTTRSMGLLLGVAVYFWTYASLSKENISREFGKLTLVLGFLIALSSLVVAGASFVNRLDYVLISAAASVTTFIMLILYNPAHDPQSSSPHVSFMECWRGIALSVGILIGVRSAVLFLFTVSGHPWATYAFHWNHMATYAIGMTALGFAGAYVDVYFERRRDKTKNWKNPFVRKD